MIPDLNVVLLKEALARNDYLWARVSGRSMRPFLKENTFVCIRRCASEDTRCGDVIVFKRQDAVIAHRVVKKTRQAEEAFLVTRADAGICLDPLSEKDELLGKITAFKIFGITIKIDNFISRVIGLGLSAVVPVLVFLILSFRAKREISQ